MKILITGTTGFIGRRLFEKLSRTDNELYLLGRNLDKRIKISSKKIKKFEYDLIKGDEKLSKKIGEVDCLVHLGGFVPRSCSPILDDFNKSFETNINGTYRLLKNFKDSIRKVVYASTLDVYGTPRRIPITEDHPTSPTSFYGLSKLVGEKIISIFCERNRIKYTILRFSNVFGEGEVFQRAIPNFIKASIKGKDITIFGDGSDIRDYIYVDDAIDAIILAIKKDCEGVYNIATGKGTAIKNLAKKIAKLSGKQINIIFKPKQKTPSKIIFDITKAERELGYFPKISLEEGLKREINWYKNFKNLN